jgi:hypothetical protein
MKKTYLAIFLFLSALVNQAQIYQPIAFPEKVEKKYIMDPVADEKKYRKKVSKKIPKKDLLPYTYACAYGKSEMFKDGKLYLNWNSLETYVNQILDSILPGNLKSKKIRALLAGAAK